MPGKILITGGYGFTGRHVRQAASHAGYEVFPLKSDLCDKSALNTEVAALRPDYVVHLAAISAVTHQNEEAFYQVNLFGTLNLLDALAHSGGEIKKVLLASSANVYGNAAPSPIVETTCPQPVNHYAMSKLAMEHMSWGFREQLPILMVRPFNYTGVGHDERFVIPKLVNHFANKASQIELGNIEVEREFNDVRMVCDVYLKLLEQGELGEIYNVCSGNPIRLRDVVELLQDITGHAIEININQDFIRPNEIQRLSGSPKKLESRIGRVQHPELRDTLTWMLGAG